MGMQRSQMEPSRSLLLDPHHQPPAPPRHRRKTSKQATNSNSNNTPPDPVIEADTDQDQDQDQEQNYLNDGESWKTTRAAAVDDVEDEDDGFAGDRIRAAEEDTADAGGVLGLLYQFQRAQRGAEGVGRGVV